LLRSAHDCSDGGLAVALAECVMSDPAGMTGADIDLSAWDSLPLRAVLFGETQGRIVVSSGDADRLLEIAANNSIPARKIGTVGTKSDGLAIRTHGRLLKMGTEVLAEAYQNAIPDIMDAAPQNAAIDDTEGVMA
ncbi:MAG TPA: AIR synthase-related protein, partial [Gemmatimonadaceae bacterium]